MYFVIEVFTEPFSIDEEIVKDKNKILGYVVTFDDMTEFFKIQYYGLAFDTAAILYVNSLFLLLSFIPLIVNGEVPASLPAFARLRIERNSHI